ncbi:MAG: hypothetical protein ACYCU7_18975, partial [Acidimicrobiales bacterium]
MDADVTRAAAAPPAPALTAKATPAARAAAKPTAAPPSAQRFVLVGLMGHLLVLHQLLHPIVPGAGEDPAKTRRTNSAIEQQHQRPRA